MQSKKGIAALPLIERKAAKPTPQINKNNSAHSGGEA